MSETLEAVADLFVFVLVITSMLAMGLKPTICQTVALTVMAVPNALKAKPIKQRRKSCY